MERIALAASAVILGCATVLWLVDEGHGGEALRAVSMIVGGMAALLALCVLFGLALAAIRTHQRAVRLREIQIAKEVERHRKRQNFEVISGGR